MAAAGGSSSSPSDFNNNNNLHLLKQIRSHEVAIAELSHLSSSRAIYQKNGNLFFRTTVPKATAFEQSQLDMAKSKLQKPESHAQVYCAV